jgi:hypothetical protein
VFNFLYYEAPKLRRDRLLRSSEATTELERMEQRNEFFRFLKEPKLQMDLTRNINERTLQTNSTSTARTKAFFDRCQFLNNTLTQNILYAGLAQNGPLTIASSLADVTMSECLFKDSFHEYRSDGIVRFVNFCCFSFIIAMLNIDFTISSAGTWIWYLRRIRIFANNFQIVLRQ